MPRQQGFVYGALLLAGAAAVTKLLGSIYTIVLQNIIGDHGMGLFQMAYPIYATLLSIATAGFPVAISKLVSERVALGDEYGVRQTFRVAAVLLSAAGVVAFIVLFFGAQEWAAIAGDANAVWAIRAISPALLIVPVMSAMRGYFQGYQQMQPTAVSQVLEQVVRVATILGLAVWLTALGYGKHIAAAGAAFGAVTGASAALLLMLYYWFQQHPAAPVPAAANRAPRARLAKQLLYYAFPISLGALVVPLMNNVDVITVVNLLKHSGIAQADATTEFGLLSGRAAKLMMLPTTLAAGIGIAVMPAVSEAFTLGFRRLMADRIDTAIRLTVMISLPSTVGLALLATPVDIALFKDSAGAGTITLMAYATLFASVQTTVAAVLQGAGYMYLPVLNLVIASALKLVGNLWLVPIAGIEGAALATVFSYATAMVLNFRAMRLQLQEDMLWGRWFGKPVVATFIMAGFVYAMRSQWYMWGGLDGGRLGAAAGCTVLIGFAVLIYGVSLLITGALTQKELSSIPAVGTRLVALCSKMGWLRT